MQAAFRAFRTSPAPASLDGHHGRSSVVSIPPLAANSQVPRAKQLIGHPVTSINPVYTTSSASLAPPRQSFTGRYDPAPVSPPPQGQSQGAAITSLSSALTARYTDSTALAARLCGPMADLLMVTTPTSRASVRATIVATMLAAHCQRSPRHPVDLSSRLQQISLQQSVQFRVRGSRVARCALYMSLLVTPPTDQRAARP